MKNLTEISILSKVKILSFTHQSIAKKLLTMGVIPGRKIEVLRKAPFGGAYYINVEENFLAIRKSEAQSIIIEDK